MRDDLIFHAIIALGLYPNKPNEEWLIAIIKVLHTKEDRTILTVSLIKLAQSALKLYVAFLGTTLSSKRPVTDF